MPRLTRWPRRFLLVAAVVVAVIVVVVIAAGVWTDYLWFQSVGDTPVFGVVYGTRWALFGVGGVFVAAATGASTALAYRLRPIYRPVGTERPVAEACRGIVEPHRTQLFAAALGLVTIVAGAAAAGAWQTWLLFVDQVPFHVVDPQFHLDIAFFVFTYPFLRLVLSFLFAAVLLALVAAALVHWLYGGLSWEARRPRATVGAQAHLYVLLGVFVLLKAAAYWVDRYGIDFSSRGAVATGASYTDVNAVLPAKTVLAVIAVLCALLFFAGAVRHSALLPGVGFGLLVLSAVLVGGLYPAVIQQFVVKPNELAKEYKYIRRELTATQRAYAISGARVQAYPGTTHRSASALGSEVSALHGIRLMDPAVVSQAFQQLQQDKGFYQFPTTLSVDRYTLPGGGRTPQDVVLAVRGLVGPPPGQANWVNSHLVYTHGFGVVAARADAAGPNGDPSFVESDIKPAGELGQFQPRVYFGPQESNYAIVGGPKGRPGIELDYPYPNPDGQRNFTYAGSGGVPIPTVAQRLAYAVKFGELNILLSGALNSHSRILYDREPLARVAKVAPFLTLDGAPYPVIADHRVLWVVDGYTTTDLYPYSQRVGLAQATATSQDPGGAMAGGDSAGQVNYIRNSVKAVVDAYSGSVTLYQWGPSDPVLQTWMKAFPGVIKRHIPAYLLPHLRYPEGLFEVQQQVLAQYHVANPQSFYGGQNFWAMPDDPTGTVPNRFRQPPYYLTMTMPGYHQPEFSLTSTFVPAGRANLAAVMVADANPTQPGYGTVRILQLPQDTAIPGPSQVQNSLESFPTASLELTQLRRGGSQVTLGNLITLPVGDGLVWVEPVYVAASAPGSSGSYPELKRVFVFCDGQPQPVGYGPTLAAALAQVFTVPSGTGTIADSGTGNTAVLTMLGRAQRYYALAQAALRTGQFAQYQADLATMKQALDAAQRIAQEPSGAGPTAGAARSAGR
ncbi:MAG TPA: UPF0182 family protein [Streptosporangiaceae bacterium]|nr:UPF0182 family protein [Streptosporangiaceae bacterium]